MRWGRAIDGAPSARIAIGLHAEEAIAANQQGKEVATPGLTAVRLLLALDTPNGAALPTLGNANERALGSGQRHGPLSGASSGSASAPRRKRNARIYGQW